MGIDRSSIEGVIECIYENVSLTSILKKQGVKRHAFFNALQEYPDLLGQYDRALAARAEFYADEIIDISDNEADAQKARNQIDARKWYASKMKPQKFGDRIDVNVSQVVDISIALKEAKARAVLPMRYPQEAIEIQKPKVLSDSKEEPAGSKPPDPQKAEEDELLT